jgi:serine/threonine protein phosphatase PrpC
MNIKVLQLHKRASYEYKNIQDRYNFSEANKCIGLSDGTTQSFKSDLWAKMVVDVFVKHPTFDVSSLKDLLKNLAIDFKNTDFKYSSNFAKAALEKDKQRRGGTATFIGLQYINDNTIKVLNCGDSCLFIIRGDKIIPFPFKNLNELDQNGFFINSTKLIDDEIEEDFFNVEEIPIEKNDKIILATDAISRLIFRKPEVLHLLQNINSFEELKRFCVDYWDNKLLEEDDISIIIAVPFSTTEVTEIIPPIDFSFPKEEEKEFIPSVENPIYINEIDTIQMEQLNRMIQQLFRETNFLKDRLKLTQVLLISALFLLSLNTALLFYFIKKNDGTKFNPEKTISITTNPGSTEGEEEVKVQTVSDNSSTEDRLSSNDEEIKKTTPEVTSTTNSENDKKVAQSKKGVAIVSTTPENVARKVSSAKVVEQTSRDASSTKTETKNDSLKK